MSVDYSSNTDASSTLLGIYSDEIQSLLRRTGYPLKQENGQRRYGPPSDWNEPPPGRGCEVFVGKLPRDCFENELVPIFEQFGRIYEVRNVTSCCQNFLHFMVGLSFRLAVTESV